jgi:hypothetical protein
MILKGEESMGCLPLEDVDALIRLIQDRISSETAQKVLGAYESGGECEQ